MRSPERVVFCEMVTSARQEVLNAFERLERRTGDRVFRLRDVVKEVMSHTKAYSEMTIRTHVTSVMCANAPVHHANHTNDLRRVGHGMYSRIVEAEAPTTESEAVPSGARAVTDHQTGRQERPWYWEGNVQATMVGGLVSSGWKIHAVADTTARATGTDIVAHRDGTRLHVEVKGYPSTTYARGDKEGEPKPTHPATQARVWFSGALMKAAMLRNDYPDDAVAVGLPAFETYQTLVRRVSITLKKAGIGVVWVGEDGVVDLSTLSDDTS